MRTLSGILFVTAIFTFFAGQGFSQNTSSTDTQKKETSTTAIQGKFVDKNNNGVCDNFEDRNTKMKGANFSDKDGDGICDNSQNTATCKGKDDCCGKGKGNMCNQGKGNCSCCAKGNGNGCGQDHQHRHGCQNQKATPATDQPSGNQKN